MQKLGRHLRCENATLCSRHCEEQKRRSNPSFFTRYQLLRGACHRARIPATRWLAMTAALFEN
jgi:hypothetical protein